MGGIVVPRRGPDWGPAGKSGERIRSVMDDLVEFLYARLDEREHFAKVARLASKHREQEFREIAAVRNIVRRCAVRMDEMDVYPNGLVSPRALLARQTLMDLGSIWNGHPDYQPEWKP